LLNFLSLRADSHAQYEIRAYADVMIDSLKRWVPLAYESFMDYRVGAMELSSKGKSVVKKMMKGEKCTIKDSGLSKREWNELMGSLGFKEHLL
jgi:thymidylate synthase (FAD)